MELAFAFVALAIPLGLNVVATRSVVRDEFSDRNQKLIQLLFVWLIPLAGAVMVLAIHRPTEAPSRRYREPPDPGDDFGLSGRTAKSTRGVLDGED